MQAPREQALALRDVCVALLLVGLVAEALVGASLEQHQPADPVARALELALVIEPLPEELRVVRPDVLNLERTVLRTRDVVLEVRGHPALGIDPVGDPGEDMADRREVLLVHAEIRMPGERVAVLVETLAQDHGQLRGGQTTDRLREVEHAVLHVPLGGRPVGPRLSREPDVQVVRDKGELPSDILRSVLG